MEPNRWIPLSHVSQSLLDTVRLAYVFGHNGREALLVTDDDEVLACGSNCSNCLGLGNEFITYNPEFVVELKNKGVKGFSAGGNSKDSIFVVAYTSSGSVYVWGKQIGSENETPLSSPSLKPLTKKITEVACGVDHCLALSVDGEVYTWGENNLGQLGTDSMQKSADPVRVGAELRDLRIVEISCGQYFSVVVDDDGQVYAWGANNHRQLCLSSNAAYSACPVRIIIGFNFAVIRKVVCGKSHVLAITNVGEVYAWGCNSVCELGLGNTDMFWTPQKIEKLEKIIDVAASASCSISAAMSETFEIFIWGDFTDHCFENPEETPFKSLHEVFYQNIPSIMYKPMVLQSPSESASVTLEKAFQDKETSDLIFRAEGKDILVHRAILRVRSDYFRLLLKDHWTETSQKVVEIKQKYNVIFSYLQFLYTGRLEADWELAIADEYQDSALKKCCERKIQRNIGIDNVATLFPLALKLNAVKMQKGCLSFASQCLSEVIKTPAFSEWDRDTMKTFFMECEKRKLFKT